MVRVYLYMYICIYQNGKKHTNHLNPKTMNNQITLPEAMQDIIDLASYAQLKMYSDACLAEIKRRKKEYKLAQKEK